MLSLAGDAERELSHAPLDLDNLSVADEIRIGDELARSYESGLHSSQQSDTEKQTEAYIQRVGDAVSAHAQRMAWGLLSWQSSGARRARWPARRRR